MIQFLHSIIDLIYKKKCYFCGKSKNSVKMCPDCYNELYYREFMADRAINSINIYSCGIYDKNLQKLIRGLKFHHQKELAYYLAKFMYEYFEQLKLNQKFQVIPVPQHKNRIKKRKYNHMELVGEEFCKLTGFVLNTEAITRVKDTKPQYNLSKKERSENLKNAFTVIKSKLHKMPILIIDDICSSGSTFEEIIKTLKKEDVTEYIICLSASSPQ